MNSFLKKSYEKFLILVFFQNTLKTSSLLRYWKILQKHGILENIFIPGI